MAEIDLQYEKPARAWKGHAYVDTNAGQRPLEHDFVRWNWSRFSAAGGTHIRYDVVRRDGSRHALALACRRTGGIVQETPEPEVALPAAGWGIARRTRSADGARVERTCENTPFYARSLLRLGDGDDARLAMHESLSLERFERQRVRLLLPFRMPRIPLGNTGSDLR